MKKVKLDFEAETTDIQGFKDICSIFQDFLEAADQAQLLNITFANMHLEVEVPAKQLLPF